MNKEELILKLNDADVNVRLDSLKQLMAMIKAGEIEAPKQGNDVNNHIHTTFSFSPYSPTKAVWMAYNAGLQTAGIMDHDSLSGAREFIEAGKIIGMMTTMISISITFIKLQMIISQLFTTLRMCCDIEYLQTNPV